MYFGKCADHRNFLDTKKRRRIARAAEADEGDNKREASAVQTIMRLIDEKRRKAMSRRMMREKGKRN